jgi:hypothetical protein
MSIVKYTGIETKEEFEEFVNALDDWFAPSSSMSQDSPSLVPHVVS